MLDRDQKGRVHQEYRSPWVCLVHSFGTYMANMLLCFFRGCYFSRKSSSEMERCKADRFALFSPDSSTHPTKKSICPAPLAEQMDSARSCWTSQSRKFSRQQDLAFLFICIYCEADRHSSAGISQSHKIFIRIPQSNWYRTEKANTQTKFIQGKHFALPNKSQLRRLKSRFLPLSVFHRQREKEISAALFSIRKQFLWQSGPMKRMLMPSAMSNAY